MTQPLDQGTKLPLTPERARTLAALARIEATMARHPIAPDELAIICEVVAGIAGAGVDPIQLAYWIGLSYGHLILSSQDSDSAKLCKLISVILRRGITTEQLTRTIEANYLGKLG